MGIHFFKAPFLMGSGHGKERAMEATLFPLPVFSYEVQCILEVFDIVSGDRHFFFGVMGERQEKGAIVLILDFLDHGKVHDVALVRAEKAQGREKRLDVAECHLRLDDPARRIEERAVRFSVEIRTISCAGEIMMVLPCV